MKKVIFFFLFCSLVSVIYIYHLPITEYILLNYIYKDDFKYEQLNSYKKQEFSYYKQTDNYLPKNKKDVVNLIYSALNNGQIDFNFFCTYEYKNCYEDVKSIIEDGEKLSNVNNFVSPFNSYSKLDISINNFGLVSIHVVSYYDDYMIKTLNQKIDEIIKEIITPDMNDYDKVLAVHDYIIDHSTYDQEKEKYLHTNISTFYDSDLAIGPLLQGHGICSGYADAFSLFLDRFNIPNYRISSDNHVWNLIYLDNKWYHIDITWDDPIVDTGEQVINHDYFMISTDELFAKDSEEHNYDEEIYLETKKA